MYLSPIGFTLMVPHMAWEYRSARQSDGHGFAACPRNRAIPTALIFYTHYLQPPLL